MKFNINYTGKEPFFQLLEVKGKKTLPLSAYIELIREAGSKVSNQKVNVIRDFKWIQPIVLEQENESIELYIELKERKEDFSFELYKEDNTSNKIVFAKGNLSNRINAESFNSNSSAFPEKENQLLDKDQFYKQLTGNTYDYTSEMQSVQTIFKVKDQIWSKITPIKETDFQLPLNIVETIFQTLLGINKNEVLGIKSIDTIHIYKPITEAIWCQVFQTSNEDSIYVVNLMDTKGRLLLAMDGIKLSKYIVSNNISHFKEIWERVPNVLFDEVNFKDNKIALFGKNKAISLLEEAIILNERNAIILNHIEDMDSSFNWLYLFPEDTENQEEKISIGNEERFVFKVLKKLQSLKLDKVNIAVFTKKTQEVYDEEVVQEKGSGIIGLLGSIGNENTLRRYCIIDIEDYTTANYQQIVLQVENVKENLLAYRNNLFYKRRLSLVKELFPSKKINRIKKEGVYVILGGAGGLGKVTTKYLIENYDAKIYWLGRREKDHSIQEYINEHSICGIKPTYIQCNANDLESTQKAINQIKYIEGVINGFIHSAIVLEDKLFSSMKLSDFDKAFNPKSLAIHNIVEALKYESLDFMCFYSSVQSLFTAPGQSNYAAGCSYKDTLSKVIQQKMQIPTYTINWGYWGSVGIVASDRKYLERMDRLGIGAIQPEEGMNTLENFINNEGLHRIYALKFSENEMVSTISSKISSDIIQRSHQKSNFQLFSFPSRQIESPIDREPMMMILRKQLATILYKFGLRDGMEYKTIQEELKIIHSYKKLFEELLNELERNQWITIQANKIYLNDNYLNRIENFEFETSINNWCKEYPEDLGKVALLKKTLPALKSVLLGEEKGTNVLFPKGSMDLVSPIYKGNKQADYFNDTLAFTLKQQVEKLYKDLKPDEKISILEVGAGTGGTSEIIFKQLAEFKDKLRYLYTDISKSFLVYAENKYTSIAPYLETTLFNIEESPKKQGIPLGSFDVVIGANVVHATPNISKTIHNIKGVLKESGKLILNELVQKDFFFTLTFGMLESWWNYNDDDIRVKGSPCLTNQKWKTVLSETGFKKIQSYPEEKGLTQQLIIAESNGEFRLPPIKEQKIQNSLVVEEIKEFEMDDYLSEVTSIVRRIAAELIKLPVSELIVDEPFTAVGYDSILIGQLTEKVNKELAVEIQPTDLFNYPSVQTLSEHIIKDHTGWKEIIETKEAFQKEEKLTTVNEENHSIEQTKESLKETKEFEIEDYLSEVISIVRRIAAELIKLPVSELIVDEPFTAVGYDSILIGQLTEKVNEELAVEVQPTDLFNYPSVQTLSEHIIKDHTGWKEIIETKEAFQKKDKPTTVNEENHSIEQTKKTYNDSEDIAIVGMSGAYGGASNLEEYWNALRNGNSLITEVPKDRWDIGTHYSPIKEEGKTYSKWGGFLKDIDKFDPGFFKISGKEAKNMDPQQRFFLKHCWHALEDANITSNKVSNGKVGVYVGVGNGDYFLGAKDKNTSVFWGLSNSILAARISYYLNLKGPALAVNSACSSSLVALDLACKSLQNKSIDLGICGGVNIGTTPMFYKMASQIDMLSNTGQCYTFDERANGFVPGEGGGAVIVKRLEDAKRDGDHIYAVVKGILTNQDGATNGIFAPSALSQEALETRVYETYKINPETISYVEAHGTGTKLGDPIEVQSLIKSFRAKTEKKNYCGIGSVKTNIGHTLHAAGLAGLHKVVLALQHKQIPPSLNYKKANPLIDFDNSPFYVNTELKNWNNYIGDKRRASISSFGFSGTNAHAVIEEYINLTENPNDDDTNVIVPISAKNKEGLQKYCEKVFDHIEKNRATVSLKALAYTFQVGRTEMEERFACIVKDKEELILKLKDFLNKDFKTNHSSKFYANNIRKQEITIIKGSAGRAFIENAIKYKEFETLAELWTKGVKIDWNLMYTDDNIKKVRLPLYPFQEDRYWVDEKEKQTKEIPKIHPLIHQNVSTLEEQRFTSNFKGDEHFITDHVINESYLFPGSAYIEMARKAGEISTNARINECYDIVWQRPLSIQNQWPTVHTSISKISDSTYQYQIFSFEKEEKIVHCTGKLRNRNTAGETIEKVDLENIKSEYNLTKDKKEVYKYFSDLGYNYGSNFQGIENIWSTEGKALVELAFKEHNEFVLEPGTLDSIFQSTIGAFSSEEKEKILFVPYSIERLHLFQSIPHKAWCLVELKGTKTHTNLRKCNIVLVNEFGETILKIEEFTILPLEDHTKKKTLEKRAEKIETQEDKEVLPKEVDIQNIVVNKKSTSRKEVVESEEDLREFITSYLIDLLSQEFELPREQFELHKYLEDFGIDSIIITKLTNTLDEIFEDIPRTLFFEYQTLEELIEYFLEDQKDVIRELMLKDNNFSSSQEVTHEATVDQKFNNDREEVEQFLQKPVEEKTSLSTNINNEDKIVIIGLAGRYPGANNIEEFWENLKAGKDSITEIPKDRWSLKDFYDEERGKPGKSYSKWGGFLDDVDKFDPFFFKISPREAEIMEPQEKLFLQTAWETIEDAGYTREQLSLSTQANNLKGNVGVFVGVMYEEYQLYGIEEQCQGNDINLLGNPSSIANRVSYFFNFHGPSMAIDTMCSSSITAVDLACQSILRGDCKAAIAGGVNVSIHPNKYQLLSKTGFVSSEGRCKSFGEGGDGYVPSEGVGAVLLKKLSDAKRDGDHIYGVIRGASLNHGGKTNGYTVPNPKAQTAVIKQAIERAKINADEISYIEAHGTGTSLGDPIEIAGLNKAFNVQGKDFICKIGSVKSNVGHCESAAGISGITKVLLQLKNRQLVPSIHSAIQNPDINFNNTPFRIQQFLEPWKVRNGKRIAGVSSFGAGGSNAHIIIEEYVMQDKKVYVDQPIPLWIISAKSEKQVREYADRILNFIENQKDISPQEIAYTLQTGRETMTHRLAFYAETIHEAMTQLTSFLNHRPLTYGYGIENAKKSRVNSLKKNELENLWKNKDEKLLELWCSGEQIKWNEYYSKEQLPKKISLPTYPFAKKRCWYTEKKVFNSMPKKLEPKVQIHPFLHQKISNWEEIKFKSYFHGNEVLLKDHLVNSEKIFPGVAQLEMARKALQEIIQEDIIQLKNMVWLKPLKINNDTKSIITSISKNKEEVIVEISSEEDRKKVVHTKIMYDKTKPVPPLKYDISFLKQKMKGKKEGKASYEVLKTIGLEYGNSFQGIKTIHYNEKESLIEMHQLPVQEGLLLQPGILDTALQATIGVNCDNRIANIQLPYSLEELNIYTTDISKASWCYVQQNHKEKSKISRYTIYILDHEGNVLIEMKDFIAIPLNMNEKTNKKEDVNNENKIGIYYQSIWEEIPFPKSTIDAHEFHAFIGSKNEYTKVLEKELQIKGHYVKWYSNASEIPSNIKSIYFLHGLEGNYRRGDLQEQIEMVELAVFKDIKILQTKQAKKIEIVFVTKQTQKVIPRDIITKKGAGIIGFAGSLAKEETNWSFKIIDISLPEDIRMVPQAPHSKLGDSLGIRNNKLYRNILIPVEESVNKQFITKLKKGGVYVILGGAGGLGKLTTTYLIKHYQAKVYWLGRREQDVSITEAIEEVAQHGTAPIYIQCDANSKSSMLSAYTKIKLTTETINGIFHSAIVLNDKVISNMSEEDFKLSFYPKSLGSQYLIDAFSEEELDFICFYSSAQSFIRAAGQSNYAAGCTYKDSLSEQVQQTLGVPTYTIHWGYWGSIGVASSEEYNQRMKKIGIGSINEKEGIEALEKVLTQKSRQLLVMKFLNSSILNKIHIFQLNKRVIQLQKSTNINLDKLKILKK